MNYLKRAIATLLSLCMMFSILAQGPAVYAEYEPTAESTVQETTTEPEAPESAVPEEIPEESSPEQTDNIDSSLQESEAAAQDEPEHSAEPAEETAEEAENMQQELAAPVEDIEESPRETPADTGAVEITVLAGIPQQREITLQVKLSGVSDPAFYRESSVTVPAAEGLSPAQGSVRFSELPDGEYTVTVTGTGFVPYRQTLSVRGLMYSLQMYTGRLAAQTYGAAHPGVLLAGDTDGSGTVDQTDVSAMLAAIESGTQADARFDLDGSGAVDLLDLQILTTGLEAAGQTLSTVCELVPAGLTSVSADQGNIAVAQGDLEAFLAGESSVQLTPSAGAEISEANPVELSFDFGRTEDDAVAMAGMTLQTPAGSVNEVTQGEIVVQCEDGSDLRIPFGGASRARSGATASVSADGTIVVDFKGQIAVKKITISITATAGGTSLAEISKVEFVNDMASRIPEPQMDIPQNLRAEAASRSFTLYWDASVNVTGYEVKVSMNGASQTFRTASTSLTVTTFNGVKLENSKAYTVQVQSVNGEWRSGYSEEIVVVPKAEDVPPAPDALVLKGMFQRVQASWKDTKDAESYNLYYRRKGGDAFTKVEGIASTSYTIQGLDNNSEYEVYVTGVNYLGEGPASLTSVVSTANVNPAKMPAYKLINLTGAPGEVTQHIKSVTHSAGYMKDSPLDSGDTAWGVVDGDFSSWYGLDDWDDGASYPDNGGIRVTFDGVYHIGSISLAQIEDQGTYSNVRVYACRDGQEYLVPNVSISKHSDGNGRVYHTIKIAGGVETDYLRVCVGYAYLQKPVSVSEMRFYEYDTLEDEILALYADALHLTLQSGVDAQRIQELQTRLDTPDEVSGELHPERTALQRELDNARGLLETVVGDVVNVHTAITTKSSNFGFTGLNAWQPLGVSAQAGEEIVVYVGGSTGKPGDSAPLQLIVTQYNSEYAQLVSSPISLKIGRNEIMIPELATFDAEHGGALYVQYTGSGSASQYAVRVGGAAEIPVLDLYGIDDAGERLARVTEYVEKLESHTSALESAHQEYHAGEHGAYNAQECIFNATDILLDQIMLSVPATQILAGLSGSSEEKAAQLLNSVDAMDQMMILFYQHKGLTDLEGAGAANALPSQHLNIRYMRMFAGAFMYAASNHIGIGWGSVTGLSQGEPVVLNEDGSYLSGGYFGWGIAHEIGHNINQMSYAVAEVTNNYFSQISQASEGVRFDYKDVYDKVTSGTEGRSSNVFTQLAMYWQLHLAYDKGYEYEIYENYTELLESRFFARVDTYARTVSAAPAPGGVALTLGGDADQNFMRLASAAAEKDLTDFFVRWGLTPDATTDAYLAQFEPETRAVYYTNDSARDYAFAHDSSSTIAGQAVLTDSNRAEVDEISQNQVKLTLDADVEPGLLLGYEITRVLYENGKQVTEVAGFTTTNTFTDTITTVNNRTVIYQITAVDQFLNRSEPMLLPAVKISHNGSYDKTEWTATTNMTSEQDTAGDATEQDPCEPEPVSAITSVIDNDKGTTYTGRADGDAVIELDFRKTLAVTGIQYVVTGGTPIREYEIQITGDGSEWKTAAAGTFESGEANTVYFVNENNDPWVCTYDASRLRLIVKSPAGEEISVSEIDVLGPTGDNVELLENGIGILEKNYSYAEGESIPAGSLIFTGSYKGNPAYNVVLLYDEDGNIVGGVDAEGTLTAQQIILAPDPEDGQFGEVSEGYWVYWIEPDHLDRSALPETVRAELYRVDNALTNEGQRLTSDTLTVQMPEQLPQITIGGEN